MEPIFVIVNKSEGKVGKSKSYKDARKILSYTSRNRAIAAMERKKLDKDSYEVVEYVANK